MRSNLSTVIAWAASSPRGYDSDSRRSALIWKSEPPGIRDSVATGVLQLYHPYLLLSSIPLSVAREGNSFPGVVHWLLVSSNSWPWQRRELTNTPSSQGRCFSMGTLITTLTPSFSILRANYRNAPHSQSLRAISRKQCAKPWTMHFLLLHTLPAQDTCAVMRRISLVSPRQIEHVSLTLSSARTVWPRPTKVCCLTVGSIWSVRPAGSLLLLSSATLTGV